MRTFIQMKTREIYNDFLDNLQDAEGLCKLKTLTYEGGNSPDYADEFIQQYYMLRWFPAYLAEYFLMYRKLFKDNFLYSAPKVLSFGCGCGIDYWGLHFAAEARGISLDDMVYRGFDIVKWSYRHIFNDHDVILREKDISTISTVKRKDYNVIIFPKSVGEFSQDVFNSVKQILADSQFNQERICVMCSVMKESFSQSSDIRRFVATVNTLEKHHSFKRLDEDDPNTFWYYTPSQGIRKVCSDFVYPDHIKNYMLRLAEECPTFLENDESCKPDCSVRLNRWPILKTDYMKWQAVRLEKR